MDRLYDPFFSFLLHKSRMGRSHPDARSLLREKVLLIAYVLEDIVVS